VTGLARVPLGGSARHIALAPSGHIYALVDQAEGRGRLTCFDPDGRPTGDLPLPAPEGWPRRIARRRLRVAANGDAWLTTGDGLLAVGPDGRPRASVDLPLEPGEQPGCFLLLPDGFLVSFYRPAPAADLGGRVARLDPAGRPRWSTRLPAGDVNYAGVVQTGVDSRWEVRPKPAWRPEDWQPNFRLEPLLLAGDRLLASYFEFRSGIGRSWCLDAATGRSLWATEPRPESSLAITGPGEFLVGSQGYGAFDLYLYGPGGTLRQHWDRHAEVVVTERGELRGVEMENCTPSRMHFSVFRPDGTVRQGPHLSGYYTTHPVVSRGGVTAFWREGELQAVDADLGKETLLRDRGSAGKSIMTRMLLTAAGTLVFGLEDELWMVSSDLGAMADSSWPCGGGNARGNPVYRVG
jgi:hypothetical protein